MSKLFSGINIKDMSLKNRIVMAPMCTDSANRDGTIKDWHCIHYAARAIGGVGLIILEAAAVEKRGRTLDNDLGLWDDYQLEGLKKIVDLCKSYGAKVGIQLAHAGRKSLLHEEDILAPSAIPFIKNSHIPREMNIEDINTVIMSFKAAAERAKMAGFDMIELHAAHGYLINQFLSPVTNKREDEYGGSLKNRARLLENVIIAVREVWPEDKPLFVRVSAEDYVEGGNHPKDISKILNIVNKNKTIDFIDVSSGGVVSEPIYSYSGYQIKYAEIIKQNTSIPVLAGGLIKEPSFAEYELNNGYIDLIYLGRELLRNPCWPVYAAEKLKEELVSNNKNH